MRSIRLSAAFAILLFVSSCASVGKLPTPSSKPEVTLSTASKKDVFDALVAWSAMHGRQVESTTQYNITTVGQIDARTSNNILWDQSSVARTIYTPVLKGNDIVVYSQRFITFDATTESSGGYVDVVTARSKSEEYNSQRAYEEMQIELEDFARYFAQNK
jgi:hypothetical protein